MSIANWLKSVTYRYKRLNPEETAIAKRIVANSGFPPHLVETTVACRSLKPMPVMDPYKGITAEEQEIRNACIRLNQQLVRTQRQYSYLVKEFA